MNCTLLEFELKQFPLLVNGVRVLRGHGLERLNHMAPFEVWAKRLVRLGCELILFCYLNLRSIPVLSKPNGFVR
jgi:hypothetical protein